MSSSLCSLNVTSQASSAIWRETADHIVARDDEHMLHPIARVIHRHLPHLHSLDSQHLRPFQALYAYMHVVCFNGALARLLQWCLGLPDEVRSFPSLLCEVCKISLTLRTNTEADKNSGGDSPCEEQGWSP
jgi:hypothetical protein